MNGMSQLSAAACGPLVGFAVADPSNQPIGTLCSIWGHAGTGRVQFVGVRALATAGRGHLVPAEGVSVDAVKRLVRLPYPGGLVHDGPAYAVCAELSLEREREIYLHYDLQVTFGPRLSSLRHGG